ncbi:MAG: hypothetical protein QOI94_557, partial [Acidobacteriaceae bacterium]|nr:hypothetical protein [Acidobacteriaceae bacterium]
MLENDLIPVFAGVIISHFQAFCCLLDVEARCHELSYSLG